MKKLLILSSMLLASVWFSACEENTTNPDPTPSANYFPVTENSFQAFQVEWLKPDQTVDFSYQDSIVLGKSFTLAGKQAVRGYRWGVSASTGMKMIFDSIPQSNDGNAAWYYQTPVSFQGLSTFTIPAQWCKLCDFNLTSSSNSWVVYNDTIPSIPVTIGSNTLTATDVAVNQTVTKISDTTIVYKGSSIVVKRTMIRSTINAKIMNSPIPTIVVDEYAGFANNIGRIMYYRLSSTINLGLTSAPVQGFRYILQNHVTTN